MPIFTESKYTEDKPEHMGQCRGNDSNCLEYVLDFDFDVQPPPVSPHYC